MISIYQITANCFLKHMMMNDDEESACYVMSYDGISLMVVLNWTHLLRKPEGAEALLPTSSCQS